MAAKRKTTAKKAIKKAPKKAPKKTAAKASKKAASTRIAKVTPSRDGLRWSIALSDGATHAVSAAAAQSVGLRVGGAWSKATDAKVGLLINFGRAKVEFVRRVFCVHSPLSVFDPCPSVASPLCGN